MSSPFRYTYLSSVDPAYLEELFQQYLQDPNSVDESWQYFFDGLEIGGDPETAPIDMPSAPANGAANGANGHAAPATNGAGNALAASGIDLSAEAKVADLINAYRENGRLLANLDPLNQPPQSHPLLTLEKYGLKESDLNTVFTAGKLIDGKPDTLRDIIAQLKDTYAGSIGVEFTHIQDSTTREWVREKLEKSRAKSNLDPSTKKFILKRLTESEVFEHFIHTRYVGQKRFSIEGGEGLITALDCAIEVGGELGANNFVMGMAHRGRLNVLTNIYGKNPEQIFLEYEGSYKADEDRGEGDVKYHMGYSADVTTRKGNELHLSLASNPSHLEFVNPVVEGMARGKQRYLGDKERKGVIPLLIHGDAAFAGQGVIYETLNLAQLPGYTTGGTIHVVLNNQIGFTTDPGDSRSTTYSTDVAKMLETPIFHVNGDDPEAIWYVTQLCTEFRQKFNKDVFIDLICYRKYGHNEGDEPSFTQPLLYKKIKQHSTPRKVYADRLIKEGVVTEQEVQAEVDRVTDIMTKALEATRAGKVKPIVQAFGSKWKGLHKAKKEDLLKPVKTAIDEKTLQGLGKKLNTIPESFNHHPKLKKFFDLRLKALSEKKGIDWGLGESLAYASLLTEGHAVRLSGQDVGRGTFSHRHAVLSDFETGKKYSPLAHLDEKQGELLIFNSHLSETGVLGFEFGWSLADPNALVIWEAQFGDFANGAQVIIDQFISSAESKWQRSSGLVLLLPHGHEGQGPEHSSARLERFLQLCGRNNMQVCNLTTPAQIFHALRRQLKWKFRKPLIIMSPKSLLRHPLAISNLDEFTKNDFQMVIDDPLFAKAEAAKKAKKVLLCTGKVYYDLVTEREKRKVKDVAIVRVEQLYPLPQEALAKILGRYTGVKKFTWVQEEPQNMGAWSYIFNVWSGGFDQFSKLVGNRPIDYIGRDIHAAPAVGSMKMHQAEQKTIFDQALESK